jgi:hypothetical protein
MWRVQFDSRNAILVTAETREEARLQAVSWAWLATGKWLTATKVERA